VTPIRSTDPEPVSAPLLAEDQVRLRWLREDLTSCLGEVGAILRRASGEQETVPAFRIAIDTTASAAEPHPPLTIAWNAADGAALTYDWRTGALRRERPPD
jgi:hypothetical protein